jgi:hypothetical protein
MMNSMIYKNYVILLRQLNAESCDALEDLKITFKIDHSKVGCRDVWNCSASYLMVLCYQ